ncbi:MAG: TIR domain-containing protein [Microcystis aeruginosa Ma_QC_Ca_00000000_S207]|jgi:formylglycine-generating enzyme required for sulfatase activity|uniref:TIR domain-containing protein n=1 Tax=Microcystis aeruginosa Ma_QC_Ca_00000000_S207 TaxID=2486251 RepID=A0A552F8Y1_MICAE|nr:SUMF1/EgtB/PvdO family nonheme iron enzyme [Microcystis aeruginosa BS11-05]NCS48818.1 SUMF1/EgtB/PvdO family nonheme iron enzyme [Microcystis aeruginosa BK11-02]TRT86660.1 MAG: TIR domain-containing protein [Microcystis aeruginosa Ma_AC_P_19900807_S299]TRU43171.1 MAG: TIR domain-containing protein [Microcystis aeruginosa Ma_QC_Ca_00000000_S207]
MKKSEIQIFLAHASEDKPAVLALHERLKQAGYKPWLDKKDLIPGQNWRSVIPKAIADSQLFIACLSQRSIAKQGFVQREFKMALNQYADRPPNSIYLIPLRLDECDIPDLRQEEYGLNLRDLHWLDYWEEDGFEQLERAITHQFNPEPEEPKKPVIVTPPLSVFNFEIVGVNAKGEQIKKESKQSQYFREDLGNGITLEMVAIPEGTFTMGTEDEEIERLVKKLRWEGFRRERPQHEVTIKPFDLGKYPITQAQWKAIADRQDLKVEKDLNHNPASSKDRSDSDRRPVEKVNWYDAVEFCARLSKLTGGEYRLPSEAEWEYACRAGTTTPFYFGETITGELANYCASNTYAEQAKGEYRPDTTPVGQFPPNAFGLYDMHGNVWEWCADTFHGNYDGAPTDGSVWVQNGNDNSSPLRGGSWFDNLYYCRSACRLNYLRRDFGYYHVGFRVVCGAGRTL